MGDYKVSGNDLTSVADAIRTKGSTSAGLSFPDGFISAIENIPTGGGSTLITKSITANGTYDAEDDNADGYSSVTVAVPSRMITGTFTGTTAGAAMDVPLSYTGSGYPVAGVIYPTGGSWSASSGIDDLAQKFAIYLVAFAKNNASTPSYSENTDANKSDVSAIYKYSDTDATSTTSGRQRAQRTYWNTNASATVGECIRMRSATTMSVYIASTSYGFPKDIEFTYHIIYSS